MRVLHFSDVHLGLGVRQVPLHDLLGKRLFGAANLLRGRGRLLARAREKVHALAELARREEVDFTVCTGDYTNLGTRAELAAARRAVEPLLASPAGFVTVPGNHDLYARDTVRERRFEERFGDLLASDLPEHVVDGPWPLVRLVGEEIAVVAVNSSRPNPPPWRSSGRIPPAQLEALAHILRDRRVCERFVFVITHYAPRRADGRPDRIDHRLLNAEEFLAACAAVRRGAILCGHIHHCFRLRLPEVGPEIFCAGSATIEGREGLWLFEVEAERFDARRGRWSGSAYVLEEMSR